MLPHVSFQSYILFPETKLRTFGAATCRLPEWSGEICYSPGNRRGRINRISSMYFHVPMNPQSPRRSQTRMFCCTRRTGKADALHFVIRNFGTFLLMAKKNLFFTSLMRDTSTLACPFMCGLLTAIFYPRDCRRAIWSMPKARHLFWTIRMLFWAFPRTTAPIVPEFPSEILKWSERLKRGHLFRNFWHPPNPVIIQAMF